MECGYCGKDHPSAEPCPPELKFCRDHKVFHCLTCFPYKVADRSQVEIVELMDRLIGEGWDCFIKWTCEKCSERCSSNKPNTFNEGGYLHEECGHLSHPKGYGLMTTRSLGRAKESPDG